MEIKEKGRRKKRKHMNGCQLPIEELWYCMKKSGEVCEERTVRQG